MYCYTNQYLSNNGIVVTMAGDMGDEILGGYPKYWKMRQRKYLKSKAHHLKPVILIGKIDLNSSILQSIDDSLKHHELIKIKFNHHKSLKEDLINRINEKINSQTIGLIGNIVILYKKNKKIKDRIFQLD